MPLRRTFDLAHLKGLHRWLFQDVYEWAGTTRNVAITKDESVFAMPLFIEQQAKALFAKLHSESLLRHVHVEDLPRRLAEHYGNLNTAPVSRGQWTNAAVVLSSTPRSTGASMQLGRRYRRREDQGVRCIISWRRQFARGTL
jgi:cell filamentation protein